MKERPVKGLQDTQSQAVKRSGQLNKRWRNNKYFVRPKGTQGEQTDSTSKGTPLSESHGDNCEIIPKPPQTKGGQQVTKYF